MLTGSIVKSQKEVNVKMFERKYSPTKTKISNDSKGFGPGGMPSCSENFHHYLMNSTLHGLRYVGETNISIFERSFFVIAFILVAILSIYFISNIYEKWSASPIIIALNAVATSITDIPFPAITICNMNQAMRSVVKDIKRGTIEDALLSSLCLEDGYQATTNDSSAFGNVSGKWTQFRNFLLHASQSCDEMLVQCSFATKTQKCMELFNTVLTDDGLCCTFNGVHPIFLLQKYNATDEFDSVNETGDLIPNDWTPETGFTPEMKNNTYPRPAAGPGSHMGLSVILNAMLDEYFCSSTSSVGFRILLHNPTETPKISPFGISVSPGFETRLVITPKISDASRLIRSVPNNQRQCIFGSEGNLSYFRTYSRKNCEMECQSRKIEESCGCVLYYMPRTSEDSNICSRKDMACVNNIMLLVELNQNQSYQCSCLPGCFEINYNLNAYTSTIGTGKFFVRDKIINEMNTNFTKNNIAIVRIYYEDGTFRSFTKEQLIGFTEFLSNTGGLLGLFMGFSVVSLIEIIYFLSIRPYCSHKRYYKNVTMVESYHNEKALGHSLVSTINPHQHHHTEGFNVVRDRMAKFRNNIRGKFRKLQKIENLYKRNDIRAPYPYVE